MKKYFLTVTSLCVFFFHSQASKKDLRIHNSALDTLPTSQLVTFLQQMNVESYYGKPVDSFLLAVPANLYNLRVYGGYDSQGALFRASKMPAYFTPDGAGPCVIIYVREYTHMDRYSPTAT